MAADVCKSLNINNVGNATAKLDDDKKGIHAMDTLDGEQKVSIISEAGMYSIILLSRKPEAKAFKRWITHEVISYIRNHNELSFNGDPWFVAADVCKALGLTQVSRAMGRLYADEGGLLQVTHPQNPEKTIEVNAVNEPGLYHLILCSKKPEAQAFKRWVTHAVIPSIRKHNYDRNWG